MTALENDLRRAVATAEAEIQTLTTRAEQLATIGMAPHPDAQKMLAGWQRNLEVSKRTLNEYLLRVAAEQDRMPQNQDIALVQKLQLEAEQHMANLAPFCLANIAKFCVWKAIKVGIRPVVANPEQLMLLMLRSPELKQQIVNEWSRIRDQKDYP